MRFFGLAILLIYEGIKSGDFHVFLRSTYKKAFKSLDSKASWFEMFLFRWISDFIPLLVLTDLGPPASFSAASPVQLYNRRPKDSNGAVSSIGLQ